jgi:hypothetical protein
MANAVKLDMADAARAGRDKRRGAGRQTPRSGPIGLLRGVVVGGGGGNRTRVLQYLTRASPGAACCAFLSPGGHAGEPPTGSVAV